MTKSAACSFFLCLLLFPLIVLAAPLDDYYLSRFSPKAQAARVIPDPGPDSEHAGHAERCLTPLYRSLKRDFQKLLPETQKTLAKELSLPVLASEATFISPTGLFTIHYARSGTDAPNLTDADQDQTPDWVEKVADVFDEVYRVEVAVMGYRQPPGARYHVYLKDLASQSVYGYAKTDGLAGSSATSMTSYIEIDKEFSQNVYPDPPEISLKATAAHEYHHAIQFGYNFYFDMWYAEATATWIEDEVFDSVNQLYGYLRSYLPKSSTLSLNAALDGGSEYGRWIFIRHLSERHTPALLKDFWTTLGTMAPPANRYEDIPSLPVLDALLGSKGSSIRSEFSGFAEKIYSRQWTTHLGDLSRILAVAPTASYSSYPVMASTISLPAYTFAYYKFLPYSTAPVDLKLVLSNVATGTDVVALKKGTDGTITSYPLDMQTKTITVPSFKSAQTAEVQLVVTNSSSVSGTQVSFTTSQATPTIGAPTGVYAIAGSARATIYFSPPASNGGSPITSYTVTSSPGNLTAARVASPVTVTGLTNGTSYTFTVVASNATGSSAPSTASNSVTPMLSIYSLNFSFAGTGGGAVNGDMSCFSGASCSPAQFVEGTTVTLIPTADADSIFGGWSDACTVIGDTCQVIMEESFPITATFNASPLLRISGGATYSLISDAFAASANDAVIQARAISFDDGTLTFNSPVSVFFKGGYDAGYSSQSGQTTVKGGMVIRDGTVRVDGLVLR